MQEKEEEHSTFSTPGEDLSQEIDTLRLRLREKEQETKELYRKFREAQSHFKEYEEEAKREKMRGQNLLHSVNLFIILEMKKMRRFREKR